MTIGPAKAEWVRRSMVRHNEEEHGVVKERGKWASVPELSSKRAGKPFDWKCPHCTKGIYNYPANKSLGLAMRRKHAKSRHPDAEWTDFRFVATGRLQAETARKRQGYWTKNKGRKKHEYMDTTGNEVCTARRREEARIDAAEQGHPIMILPWPSSGFGILWTAEDGQTKGSYTLNNVRKNPKTGRSTHKSAYLKSEDGVLSLDVCTRCGLAGSILAQDKCGDPPYHDYLRKIKEREHLQDLLEREDDLQERIKLQGAKKWVDGVIEAFQAVTAYQSYDQHAWRVTDGLEECEKCGFFKKSYFEQFLKSEEGIFCGGVQDGASKGKLIFSHMKKDEPTRYNRVAIAWKRFEEAMFE